MHLFIGLGLAFALVVILGILLFVLVLSSVILVASVTVSVQILSWMARCPACSCKAMRLVTPVPFGNRFYRCSHCGARFKRKPFAWCWKTASGPEDDARYRRRGVRTWVGGATADVSDTTCGELLVRKKSWILATLVHRTGGGPRVIRPTPPNMAKCFVESDTTVGRLLRKKLFRGNSSDWKSPPDPWHEF